MRINNISNALILLSTHFVAIEAFQPQMLNQCHSSLSIWTRSHREYISRTRNMMKLAVTTNQKTIRHFMKERDDDWDQLRKIQSDKTTSPQSNMQSTVNSLLQKSVSRAMSTIFTDESTPTEKTEQSEEKAEQPNAVIDAVVSRASDRIETVPETPPQQKQHQDKRTYLSNPAVTQTALAHSLWAEVIQPYGDVVIDATAGNGKDSLILSKMLFPDDSDGAVATQEDSVDKNQTQLISIDIQQLACVNTKLLLEENLNSNIFNNNVQVMHKSHAPMPSLPKESVGLICYNLGYLPGADKEAQTQMTTSIYSLADSALLIRSGGLLSVMSYPGNGWKEHSAVSYFMEGLAMFTSRSEDGWRGFVDAIPSDYELEMRHNALFGLNADENKPLEDSNSYTVRSSVKLALERVKSEGFEKQTWRVFDHRPLGRPLSPILFSGMRIK